MFRAAFPVGVAPALNHERTPISIPIPLIPQCGEPDGIGDLQLGLECRQQDSNL